MAGKRAKDIEEPQIPDISDDFSKFADLNPEYDLPMSERAEKEFSRVAYDENGKELPLKKFIQNVELFRIRIRAIIPQLAANEQWMRILESVTKVREKLKKYDSPDKNDQMQSVLHRHFGLLLAVASTEESYQSSPRTMEKTVQDIFVNDTERLFINRQENTGGHWDLSLTNIAPNKINNKILENLGLTEYLPPKGSKRIEKEEAYARAIPAIKEMLCDLDPLVIDYGRAVSKIKEFRLLRIGKGANKGYILGTQNIKDKKTLFKTDIHGAYRRVSHIRDNYDYEFRVLSDIQQQIADVNDGIDNETIKEEEERKRIEQIFMELFARLRNVTDADKVNMKKKLEKCSSLKSERKYPQKNKVNPDGTATVLRPAYSKTVINLPEKRTVWASVKTDIAKRKLRVEKIRPWLEKDRTKIHSRLLDQQAPFRKFYSMVEKYEDTTAPQAGRGLHIFRLDEPLNENTRDRLIKNLQDLKKQFNRDEEWFEPYGAFAEKMTEHIDSTISRLQAITDCVENEGRKKAAEEFLKIYLAAKVEKFYVEYQNLLSKHIAVRGEPDFEKAIGALDNLENNTKQKPVKSDLESTEYYQVFAEIYHLLNSLKKRCREALAITGNDKERIMLRKNKIKELRARARNFRFDRLIRSGGTEY